MYCKSRLLKKADLDGLLSRILRHSFS